MVTIKNPLTVVQTGGGPTPGQPLDPEQVYRDTRPADWLVMPEIGENEDNVAYFLLAIGEDRTEDVPFSIIVSGTNITVTWEFGITDSAGNFTPISALTRSVTGSNNYYPESFIPASAFSNVTSEGEKQVLCKITSTGNITELMASNGQPRGLVTRKIIREFKGKASQMTGMSFASDSSLRSSATKMRYFDLIASRISGDALRFQYCRGLVAIPHFGLSSSNTSFSYMFEGCTSLVAIPQLNTSNGTNFSYMFSGCYSLISIPQLDTSAGTSFTHMFENCYSLSAIPQLDTSAGTGFSYMFKACYSLTSVPQLDTSAGTSFSYMFSECHSLVTAPQLDTSKGTSFNNMFSSCYSLSAVPQLDTSLGTNFSNMFANTYALTEADLTGYDFSGITSASGFSGFLSNTLFSFVAEFGDKWPVGGIPGTQAIVSTAFVGVIDSNYSLRVKINKTDAMLPISANATTLFSTSQYVYVYVPDNLLTTYQADAYWNTLGTRLKGFSDLPS